jgi:hypothetical protein
LKAAVGLAFGLYAALLVTRLLSSLLFQVSPTDPNTLVGASLLLLAVAAAASDLPARHASIRFRRCDRTESGGRNGSRVPCLSHSAGTRRRYPCATLDSRRLT